MTKYSIIVPVYNTEKYLDRCFSSLVSQTYSNYEIIVVNDGSTDGSMDIVEYYCNKFPSLISVYNKKNSGNVAEPRNFGVEKVTGDYILFVDSDDYISENTLKIINEANDNYDIIAFSGSFVSNTEEYLYDFNTTSFDKLNGSEALVRFISNVPLFEVTCRYVYRTGFFRENKFKYQRLHEDFGLTPLVIAKAKSVRSISDKLYFYRQSDNSITRNSNYKRTVVRAYDMLYHFDYLYKEFNNDKYSDKIRKILNSYIANAVIAKIRELNSKDKKAYKKELNKRKVKSLLIDDTFFRKLKKLVIYINVDLYLLLK